MKNKSENIIFRTFESDKNVTEYYDQNQIKKEFIGLPSSKQDINFNIINTTSESNGNSTNFSQGNNTSSFNLNTNENYLFGNDFMAFEKPKKLGKQRNYLYIKKYPIISKFIKNSVSNIIYNIFYFSYIINNNKSGDTNI